VEKFVKAEPRYVSKQINPKKNHALWKNWPKRAASRRQKSIEVKQTWENIAKRVRNKEI
jgi:hypothetical protein